VNIAGAIADYTPNVVIVTGAANGIGRSITLRLADEGFDVAVNDIPEQLEKSNEVVKLIKAKSKKALAVVGDVSVEADVEKLVAETVKELGGVDAMIANAGIGAGSSILQLDMNMFDRVIAVNLRGVMLCYKHASIQMVKQQRGGRLIAASSVIGKKAIPYATSCCASKLAVRAISQSTSVLRQHLEGVNFNASYGGMSCRCNLDIDAVVADTASQLLNFTIWTGRASTCHRFWHTTVPDLDSWMREVQLQL